MRLLIGRQDRYRLQNRQQNELIPTEVQQEAQEETLRLLWV